MLLAVFIIACVLLAGFAAHLERTDHHEHQAYHRLMPAEDGCYHEVEPQPITDKPGFTECVNRQGDACPYCVRGIIVTSLATYCEQCAEDAEQGRLLLD